MCGGQFVVVLDNSTNFHFTAVLVQFTELNAIEWTISNGCSIVYTLQIGALNGLLLLKLYYVGMMW